MGAGRAQHGCVCWHDLGQPPRTRPAAARGRPSWRPRPARPWPHPNEEPLEGRHPGDVIDPAPHDPPPIPEPGDLAREVRRLRTGRRRRRLFGRVRMALFATMALVAVVAAASASQSSDGPPAPSAARETANDRAVERDDRAVVARPAAPVPRRTTRAQPVAAARPEATSAAPAPARAAAPAPTPAPASTTRAASPAELPFTGPGDLPLAALLAAVLVMAGMLVQVAGEPLPVRRRG